MLPSKWHVVNPCMDRRQCKLAHFFSYFANTHSLTLMLCLYLSNRTIILLDAPPTHKMAHIPLPTALWQPSLRKREAGRGWLRLEILNMPETCGVETKKCYVLRFVTFDWLWCSFGTAFALSKQNQCSKRPPSTQRLLILFRSINHAFSMF